MLNKIFEKIESLIADYEKTGNKKTLGVLCFLCGNMSAFLIDILPAMEIHKIENKCLTSLYDMQSKLNALHTNGMNQQKTFNLCKDIYNLVMEHKNENW